AAAGAAVPSVPGSGVPGSAVPGAAVPAAAALPAEFALRACSSCTSSSSCSRNWRAMARARPIQRPISVTTRGSFSGPSTISARTKMISNSENRPSNRSRAPLGLRVALLRGDVRGLRVVRALGADLLRRSALLLLALAHGLFESAHGGAEIGADAAQLLRAEHDEHDEQDHHELAHP